MSDQIKSNDKPFLDNIINSYVHPYIKPPFPPLIDPKDLISKSIIGNKPNRAPNAFIIYRKMYVREARSTGYCFPMTVLSSMVSQSWEKEPEEVKNYYKKLAKEAFDYRNKLYPKPESKRKKRSNWNVISFEKKILNSNDEINDFNDKKIIINDNNVEIKKNESTFTPSEQTELDFINQISTPDLSYESSTTTSPIIEDWSIDELNTIDFNSRNVLSNPNLTPTNFYMNSYDQQSFENFQDSSYEHFTNQIIDNQIQYYNNINLSQNNEMFCNVSQLNYCQVNPNILSSSSPNVFGIFEYHEEELASNLQLQPFYSNLNPIPDNTCVNHVNHVNQQFYIPEPLDYYPFY